MSNIFRTIPAALLLLASTDGASAQEVVIEPACPPTVTYYQPVQPVVAYSVPRVAYSIPAVAYSVPVAAYSPRVAYYAPSVSYYAAPSVSYYAAPVTTTRYGFFGQPRRSTTYYPGYIVP